MTTELPLQCLKNPKAHKALLSGPKEQTSAGGLQTHSPETRHVQGTRAPSIAARLDADAVRAFLWSWFYCFLGETKHLSFL